jgi:uncharacterized protein DUF4266
MLSISRLLLLASLVVVPLISTGCVTVQAWERGRLANPEMKFDDDASLTAYQAHWQEAREGAAGGAGVQAGGCGCK